MLIADRYDVGERLGAGGSGTVFRATDSRLRRTVALKVIESCAATGMKRQLAEIRTMAAATGHPNVVTLFDALLSESQPGDGTTDHVVLVMELVDGPSLAEVIRHGPLPLGVVRRLGLDLSSALAHLHRQGIVHRDVKPANVLLSADGTAKVADFGVSRLLDGDGLTATNFLLGSAGYISPEQVEGHGAADASDVYSLGLVLLECITGRREYTGTQTEAVVARLHRQPAMPVGLPASLHHLLSAMIERDPTGRPTAAEVAAALADCDVREGPVAKPAPDGIGETLAIPAPPRPPRPRWAWPIGIAAAIIIAVLIGAWGIASRTSSPSAPPGPDSAVPAAVTSEPAIEPNPSVSAAEAPGQSPSGPSVVVPVPVVAQPDAVEPAPVTDATGQAPAEPTLAPAPTTGDEAPGKSGNAPGKTKDPTTKAPKAPK